MIGDSVIDGPFDNEHLGLLSNLVLAINTARYLLNEPAGLGDMNCDGTVDYEDLDPFVLALNGQEAYESEYPDCVWLYADCNGDFEVNYDDIEGFVVILGWQ